jgi:3-hydroxyacyl-[acyl-carrier-protein] dehydratase
MTEGSELDVRTIQKRLPHRYPFLLLDRVRSWEAHKSLVAIKNVSINEPYFQGHFPGRPVMPGVLVIEAMAQAAGLLAFLSEDIYPSDESRFYFVGIDKARFRRPVLPGDQLLLKVVLERRIRTIWKFSTVAEVAGQEACSAEMMVMPG